jgi:hypothetical protein
MARVVGVGPRVDQSGTGGARDAPVDGRCQLAVEPDPHHASRAAVHQHVQGAGTSHLQVDR